MLLKKLIPGILLLLALTLGLVPAAQAQTQDGADILLNLESIKLDMERIRQEAARLSLVTRGELLRELELLRAEMEVVRQNFQRELDKFRGIARQETFETIALMEKFRDAVGKILQEVEVRLEDEKKEFERLQAEALKEAELNNSKTVFGDAARLATTTTTPTIAASRTQVPKAELVLPRIKLAPDKSLVIDSVKTTTPGLDLKSREGRASGGTQEFGELVSPDEKYTPKFYSLQGEDTKKLTALERHRLALMKFSERIRKVKGKLSSSANRRSLLLNLGRTYLESERYFQSMDNESSRTLAEADAASGLILGGYQAALLAFKTALNLNPKDGDTSFTLAKIYDELKDGQNAVNFLERARYLFQEQSQPRKERVADRKLRELRKKYPETWICRKGTSNPCVQNAGRNEVASLLFKSNLAFRQKGVTPPPFAER